MGADVEDTQHGGLSRSHSPLAITRDNNDAVNLVLERVDPVGHELAVDGRTGIAEVRGILLLTVDEGGVTQVVLDSQLDHVLVYNFVLTVVKAPTLVRPN